MALRQLSVEEGVEAIAEGKLIAYPTEGVFGLGCDPLNLSAVQALLKIKDRDVAKGLILVAAHEKQLYPLTYPDHECWPEASSSWPGPVTWLVPARPSVPQWLRGNSTKLAVRVSAHPVCSSLCERWGGPIVSTSANPAGRSPAMTSEEVGEYFPQGLAGVVAGELGGLDQPTAIRDLETGGWIREGGNEHR